MATLQTAWLTNVDGDKLYAWSHVKRVRYNDSLTAEDKLGLIDTSITNLTNNYNSLNNRVHQLEESSSSGSGSGESGITLADIRTFIQNNYLMSTLYDIDGTTVIGFTLE